MSGQKFASGGLVPPLSARRLIGDHCVDSFHVSAAMLGKGDTTSAHEISFKIDAYKQSYWYYGPLYKRPVGAYREMVENIDRVEPTPASLARRNVGYRMRELHVEMNRLFARTMEKSFRDALLHAFLGKPMAVQRIEK